MQGAVTEAHRSLWVQAWATASSTTTGHDEGSKFWCVMRDFLRAYTTITDEAHMLEAMDDFHYLETGYAMTRSAIELLFA